MFIEKGTYSAITESTLFKDSEYDIREHSYANHPITVQMKVDGIESCIQKGTLDNLLDWTMGSSGISFAMFDSAELTIHPDSKEICQWQVSLKDRTYELVGDDWYYRIQLLDG